MHYSNAQVAASPTTPVVRRLLRLMVAVLVIVAALAVNLAVDPDRAQASTPTCYGMSCEGLDPVEAGCADDAVTIQSNNALVGPKNSKTNYGHLEMRYSPSCHSNWVRYTGWSGPEWYIGWFITNSDIWASPYIWRHGVAGTLQGPSGHSSLAVLGSPTFWSKMVTADGKTCSSVELAATIPSESGYGASDMDELGPYNAPCIS